MPIHLEEFNAPASAGLATITPGFPTQAVLNISAVRIAGAGSSVYSMISMATIASGGDVADKEFTCQVFSYNGQTTPVAASRAELNATAWGVTGGNNEASTLKTAGSFTPTQLKYDFNPIDGSNPCAALCFGGLSERPDLREITISANGTQTIDLGWGGAPDLILGMSSWTTATAGSGPENHGHLGFYASTWDGTNEAGGGVFTASEDDPNGDASAANSDTERGLSETTWWIYTEASSGRESSFNVEIVHAPAVAGAGKYQVITTNHLGAGSDCKLYLMALRGIRAQYVSDDAPTGIGPHSVTGAGFPPTHIVNWNNEDETTNDIAHGGFALYMADASNNYGMWMRDKNNVATTVAERRWDDSQFCRAEDPSTSNNKYLSTLTSLDADGHTENATLVNTAIKRGFLYLADDIRTRRHLPILGTG